jgi:hypothetical protein
MRTGLVRDVLRLVASSLGSDNPEASRKATSVSAVWLHRDVVACGVLCAHTDTA